MNRLQRAAVLLTLLDALKNRGSWCGETHLQKAVYFLEEMCGVPLGFSYILYRHGPYSFEFSDEITALRADLLLDLQLRPPYGPTIVLGQNAQQLLANYPTTIRFYEPQITFVAERLGRSIVIDLERLATALYVTRESSPPADDERRAARLHEVKPHISIADAKLAIRQIDAMLSAAPVAIS